MTSAASDRDDGWRILRSCVSTQDGLLDVLEGFVEHHPDLAPVFLDRLAGFHDHHRQPRQAAVYREQAAALRKRIGEDEAAREMGLHL